MKHPDSPHFYPLGKEGEYGYFIFSKGLLVYADTLKQPQIEIPARILQDVLLTITEDPTMTMLQLAFNFEVGFEMVLPATVAEHARLWILSVMGLIEDQYKGKPRIEIEKKKEDPRNKAKPIHTILVVVIIIALFLGIFRILSRPLFIDAIQTQFIKENPYTADMYYQKGVQEETNGNLTSAIIHYRKARQYNPKNRSINEHLDHALETKIQQNLTTGNYSQVQNDIDSLSLDNPNRVQYQEKLRKVSQNSSIHLRDCTELLGLFFQSLFSQDPRIDSLLEDRINIFRQKVEFTLQR